MNASISSKYKIVYLRLESKISSYLCYGSNDIGYQASEPSMSVARSAKNKKIVNSNKKNANINIKTAYSSDIVYSAGLNSV